MFLKNSRYFGLHTILAHDRSGREVTAVKLRPLLETDGDLRTIAGHDHLDVIAEVQYRDAARFWHIADANSELEANELVRVAGRVIIKPRS